MRRSLFTLVVGFLLVLLFGLLLVLFQVRQSEVAVVTTFGRPTKPITEAGRHWKLPWPIQRVYRFDKRIQNFEDPLTEGLTRDSFNLLTSVYVGWKITDPSTFLLKFAGNADPIAEAERGLERLLGNAKSGIVGKHPLSDFVSATDNGAHFLAVEQEILAAIQAQVRDQNYGLNVEFLGFKKVEFPDSVTQTVFDRMQSERKVLADKFQYEGEAKAQEVRSEAERKAAETLASANAEATRIRGEGEAKAAESLKVFQQNPELANFIFSLNALEGSLKEKAILVFDQNTPPYNLFRGAPTNLFNPPMNGQPHSPDQPRPLTPLDAGSQALSEALRSSFAVIRVVMVILVVVFLASGFFTVGPQERAVILRFGRPVAEGQQALLDPGLHWSYPYPIDEVVTVSITGIQQVRSTTGWYATTPEQELAHTEPPPGPSLNPAVDGYTLTADNNIVHTRATLSYRINDPIRYVFAFVNASNAVQNALDNALLYESAHFGVDDILTRERLAFSEAVKKRTTELAAAQDLGIIIEQCTVESIAPRKLKEAFETVLKAEVNRTKVLNEAHSHEIQVLSKASADASSRTNTAASESARLVAEVSSRARQFEDLLPKYQASPKLFVQQRLTETLGRVFANAQDKIYIAESADGKRKENRFLFNREPPKKPEEPKP